MAVLTGCVCQYVRSMLCKHALGVLRLMAVSLGCIWC